MDSILFFKVLKTQKHLFLCRTLAPFKQRLILNMRVVFERRSDRQLVHRMRSFPECCQSGRYVRKVGTCRTRQLPDVLVGIDLKIRRPDISCVNTVLKDERSPIWFLPLDVTICLVKLVFYEIRPKLQLFLAQIKDKQMPPNAPPKVFKKVDTSLVKMQIKFGLRNKKVPTPSIGRKTS